VGDVLIVGDSLRSPEIRHEVPVAVPDPFVYVERNGHRVALVSSLEAVRLEQAHTGLDVRTFERYGGDELALQGLLYDEVVRETAARLCEELGVRDALVPPTFPLEVADRLREIGVQVRADRELFFERRRVKNEVELAGIRRAQAACEAANDAAREMLRRAEPSNGVLRLDGEPLTCERLKMTIDRIFGEHGTSADESIVSHGAQTAVGHDMGSGAIAPGEPIILDLFPRDRETGCYSDMTRTYVVGTPPEELAEYHRVVREALDRSLEGVRAGADGRQVFRDVCAFFEEHGYPTILSKTPGETLDHGFTHSLGHGVGLEVHEQPSLGRAGHELVAGDVITLEPGLYRRGFGGCRLEDVVRVTEDGVENLTRYPYDLEP
jgi:Xaa-Pro aminopeptidase